MQAPTISVDITENSAIVVLPLDQIHFNPHQMWAIDPAHVAELAEDIQRNGVLQRPLARPHPAQAGHVQLAFGHHRRAAAAQAGLQEMAVEVRDLTDLEMADYAITENFKRRTPTALDKARALQRLMVPPFSLTQAEAGKRFGLSQSAVANLVRMLRLPDPIQKRIDSGELPERMARGLVTLASALPEAAVQVAAKVAAAEGENKELVYADAVDNALENFGQRLPHNLPFKLDAPLTTDPRVAAAAAALGIAGEFPACKGCEHFMDRNHQRFCSRPPCYAAKVQIAQWAALKAPAKALGIQVAGPEERVSLVCAGGDDEELRRLAQAALKAKDANLRLVPAGDKGGYPDWRKQQWRKEWLYGAEFAALATVNGLANLKKAYPAPAAKSAKSEAERAAQLAEANEEREKRYAREERERKREKAEIERLYGLFMPLLAKLLPDQPALLRLIWDSGDQWYQDKPADWDMVKGGLQAQKLAAARTVLAVYEESPEAVTILEDMDIPNLRMSAAGTAATLRALGQELKLKLPADFEPPAPKIAEDEDAPAKGKAAGKKAPAKKGGKK